MHIYLYVCLYFFVVRAWLIYFYSFPYYIVHRFVPVHAKPQHIDDDPPATVLCCVNEARLHQPCSITPKHVNVSLRQCFPIFLNSTSLLSN